MGLKLKKCQFRRYVVITLKETLSSGLASDSVLFLNPASPDPVRGDRVVISCNRRNRSCRVTQGASAFPPLQYILKPFLTAAFAEFSTEMLAIQ